MDGQQSPRNPNDMLIIHNIDDDPTGFEWQYDAIRTPLPYFLAKGETRDFPYYIGRHGVEKLIDKVLQKQGRNHMNLILRAQLRKQIVLGIKHINNMRAKTANELALEELQRKKDADPYEELFKEREVEMQRKAEAELNAQQPKAPLYQTQATPIVPPTAVDTAIPTQTSNDEAQSLADPVRASVYHFLETRAHLDLTHAPTKDKLDSMTVDDIKVEFGPEYPDIIDSDRSIVPDSKADLAAAGMPITPAGNPVIPQVPPQPTQPVQTVAQPAIQAAPIRPTISMNPTAPAAPILDGQLQQAGK